jgi:hypothetical protein
MMFLQPAKGPYPFDRVCRAIVLGLKARNFNVPGMKVDFHEFGSGENQFADVSTIRGKNFRLWFCRKVGRIEDTEYNNNSAVTEISIPGLRLNVYAPQEQCGPTLYKYVGPEWDQERFLRGLLCNSKLHNEPRTYLIYKGRYNDWRDFHWPERLVPDNDLGREYSPQENDPKFYETDKIFAEVTGWLESNVLRTIKYQPLPTEIIDIFKPAEPVPIPSRLGPLFTVAEHRDAVRILTGRKNLESLHPSDRYALEINYRFVHLGVPSNGGIIPDAAYHGSVWCGIGAVDESSRAIDLEIPGYHRWMDSNYVARVVLNRANDVYIADMDPYERVRESLFARREKGYHLSDEEVNLCSQASGRTVIPLASYKGGYRLPVILVNRQLELDEIEIVNGPDDEINRRANESILGEA